MMTMTATNAETIGAVYAAFGRGDIAFVLDQLAGDVVFEDWPDNYAQQAGVTHLARRTGRAGAEAFFAAIQDWVTEEFAVRDILASERQVVADLRVAWRLPNGAALADDELHLWTFDDAGKIARLRHYVDTAKHIASGAGQL
jgi:ketosteroid isomerase-like protein